MESVAINNQLTILHVTGYERDEGGVLTHIRNLAKADGRIRRILLVGLSFQSKRSGSPKLLRLSCPDAETIDISAIVRSLWIAIRLRKWIGSQSGRCVHGHTRFGLLVVLWLRLMGCKQALASIHCHGQQRWFYRLCYRFLGDAHMVWLTPSMANYYGAPEVSWSRCQPPPHSGLLSATTHSISNENRPTSIHVLGLGEVSHRKGWHLMVQALEGMTPEERERIFFEHYGVANPDDPYVASLTAKIATADLGSQIRFNGWHSNPWGAVTHTPDFLLMPSYCEPLGNVMLEALCRAIPVIAANTGGPASVIISEKTGLFFDPYDPLSLRLMLRRTLQQSFDFDSQAAIESLKEFEPMYVADKWRRRYQALL
jgi:glycosyltransferase involved in cell wall biosynthesis